MGEWRLYEKRGKNWWAFLTRSNPKQRQSTEQSDKRNAQGVVDRWNRERATPLAREIDLETALANLVNDRENRGRAKGTVKMHKTKAVNLLRILGAQTPLKEIDAQAVDHFIATRRAETIREGSDVKVSSSTIGKELSTLRGALRLARRQNLYPYDHAAVMPIGWANKYKPRTKHPSPEEAAKIIAALRPDRAAHVAFLIGTGSDIGESFDVVRGDIDTEKSEITMRGTKTQYRAATIPISPLGRSWVDYALERAPRKTGPLFAKWQNIRRDLHKACDKANVPRYSPKDLRRACASWLVQGGVDLFAVSKILRHGSTRMVEAVYGQHTSRSLRDTIERQLGAAVGVPVAVTRLCQTSAISSDPGDACDGRESQNQRDFSCPGTESNRRHGDFQASGHGGSRVGNPWCFVSRRRRIVTGLCPLVAPPLAPEAVAMRLAKVAAERQDQADTIGYLLDVMRAQGVA